MTCPYCGEELTCVVKYFDRHQTIRVDENGKIVEAGPVHDDGIGDVACGNCLHSLQDNSSKRIQDLVARLCELEGD